MCDTARCVTDIFRFFRNFGSHMCDTAYALLQAKHRHSHTVKLFVISRSHFIFIAVHVTK